MDKIQFRKEGDSVTIGNTASHPYYDGFESPIKRRIRWELTTERKPCAKARLVLSGADMKETMPQQLRNIAMMLPERAKAARFAIRMTQAHGDQFAIRAIIKRPTGMPSEETV